MREEDQQRNHFFGYVSPEAPLWQDHPAACDPGLLDKSVYTAFAALRYDAGTRRVPIGCAGKATAVAVLQRCT